MSDPSGQLLGLHIMLTDINTNEWKDAVIDKAQAYDILMGTEVLNPLMKDTATIASFKSCQMQLAVKLSCKNSISKDD